MPRPAPPKHPKMRGEWAEQEFISRAMRLGLKLAKPIGDCARYDVLVEAGSGFHRIQVKSTTVEEHGSYRCVYFSSAKFHNYTPEDFDFLAAYIIPEDVWFIIPSAVISTSTVTLDPAGRNPRNKYNEYREAWPQLFERPGRFCIHASAVEWLEEPAIP